MTKPLPFQIAVLCAYDPDVDKLVKDTLRHSKMWDTEYNKRRNKEDNNFAEVNEKWHKLLDTWQTHPVLKQYEPDDLL